MPNTCQLDLKRIDLKDRFFIYTFLPNLDNLFTSIRKAGILHPLVVQEKGSGNMVRIICGFKRALVAEKLKLSPVTVLLYSADEINELEAFRLSLLENLGTRPLNLVEKAICLEKLITMFKVEQEHVINEYLPLLSLHPHQRVLESYLRIARLQAEAQTLIARNELPLAVGEKFFNFRQEDQEEVAKLLSHLKTGIQVADEILTHLYEISQREEATAGAILNDLDLWKTVEDEKENHGNKTRVVRQRLRKRRFPGFTHRKESFRKAVGMLPLAPTLTIIPSPSFEREDLKVTFSFRGKEDLDTMIHRLEEIASHPAFGKLWEA